MIDEWPEGHLARRPKPVKAPVPRKVLYQRESSQHRSKNGQDISQQEQTFAGCEEVRGYYESHDQEEQHRHYIAGCFYIHGEADSLSAPIAERGALDQAQYQQCKDRQQG